MTPVLRKIVICSALYVVVARAITVWLLAHSGPVVPVERDTAEISIVALRC